MCNKTLGYLLAIILSIDPLLGTLAQQWASLTTRDGLSGMSVFRIQKDSNQQAWIATSYGVTLYNGRSLYVFPLEDNNHSPIACIDLVIMENGDVVVATSQGIYRVDLKKKGFVRILPDIRCGEALLAVGDTLYVGGADGLFVSIDRGQSSKTLLKPALNSPENTVRCVRRSTDGYIWFTTSHQLNRYDTFTGKTTAIITNKEVSFSRFDFAGGRVFLGTKSNGVLVGDIVTGSCQPLTGINKIITDVEKGSDANVYIGTDGDGAYLVDSKTLTIINRYHTNEPFPYQLRSNAVYCFMQDDCGILWVGFYHNGLSYQNRGELLFNTYSYGSYTTENQDVTAFLKDDSNVIIGTNKGVYWLNPTTNSVASYSAERTGRNIVKDILPFDNYYYICYYDGGVKRLNKRTMALEESPIDLPSFKTSSFTAAALSPDNELWLSNNDGIWVIDSVGKYVNYNERNSRIYSGPATSIHFDTSGNAILSFSEGLVLYVRSNHSFTTDVFPDGYFNHTGNLQIRPLVNGTYVAFGKKQIFYTDNQMEHFGQWQLPETILKENCIDVIDDGRGYYWLATESGLFRIDYGHSGIRQIPLGHGLTGTQLNRMCMDNEHRLWLETQKGLFVCNLDSLNQEDMNSEYKILLCDVVIGEKRLSVSDLLVLNGQKQVRVPWNLGASVLSIHLTATDYYSEQKRFYEYRIDGGKISLLDSDEELSLKGLTLGRHTLDVQLSGIPGTRHTYTIMVLPTALFYAEALFFLLLLVFLYMWWRYRKNTQEIIVEHIETEQALIEESRAQWEDERKERQEKYAKVRFDMEEMKEIFNRMDEYMHSEKPYLNPDFRLKDIASALDVSQSVLSQVFTIYAKESYYDYVNRYRLNAFKSMIAEVKHHQLTLNAMSEQCGFKRSSFFSTFRRMEGVTPYQYMKKCAKN